MADKEDPPALVSGGGKKSKRGGLRNPPGGRPVGSTNALELGAVKAIKAAKLRIPEGTPPEDVELAEEAKQRIIDVMREKVDFKSAPHVLKASTRLRDEVCGPLAQRQEITGADGQPFNLNITLTKKAPK